MSASQSAVAIAGTPLRSRPWLGRLVAAYVRRELPGWGRIYAAAGGDDETRWAGNDMQWVRGKLHGYDMELDLGNWSERLTWYFGRYHDLLLQQMLVHVLREGDCFVDIGANLGMLTLLARSRIGERGRVIACEPNPRLVRRVQQMLDRNGLTNVQLVECAVSDRPGKAELHEYGGHSGWGSLSTEGPEGIVATSSWTVACRSGDELLADTDPAQPVVIKIDVEGHEVPVLQSLQQTLATRWPLVFCEVVDAHQRRAGYSAKMLRTELEQHGYRPFVLEGRRRALFRHQVALRPLASDEQREVDVLFVPPRGPLAARVAPLLPA